MLQHSSNKSIWHGRCKNDFGMAGAKSILLWQVQKSVLSWQVQNQFGIAGAKMTLAWQVQKSVLSWQGIVHLFFRGVRVRNNLFWANGEKSLHGGNGPSFGPRCKITFAY